MKFKQIPINTFETQQLNAGIFLKNFDPKTGKFQKADIMGATTGGAQFSAAPTFSDLGEDIDNCPKNTMELMNLDQWEISMSGTFVTLSKDNVKRSLGAAFIDTEDETHIVLRRSLEMEDFTDIWWVGDYGKEEGYLAIHLYNCLNTNGFTLQSTDNGKGQFAFTFTCHFSQKDVDKLPCDIYVVESSETSGATDEETESGEPTGQSGTYSTGKFDNLTEE
ncbi:MAG: hypothetical protein NC253_05305 [Ruminococcus sp.]|nr:hypothetical protein [Ruminococcus sp.]MCM1380334.1 hypothetical protein [Muribaculaceae bacterium]MCM1478246.1 hypothetical protein [Muribaculaceae bacterium]